jgi:CRP/FNR family transcriptional regulator
MAPSDSAIRQAVARFEEPRRSGHDVEALLGIGLTLEKAAGQTIIVEGDRRTHAYRVLAGAVRLYKSLPDGRRQVIDFLVAGDCFGLLGIEHYTYSVEAIVRSTVARYPRANIETAVRSNPQFAVRLLEFAETDLERAHVQMLLLGRKSAEEKVAAFLMRFASRRDNAADGRLVIRLPVSRQDMADYLGLTIETVSRTLSRLRQDGLIALESRQQVVLERPLELEALADAC